MTAPTLLALRVGSYTIPDFQDELNELRLELLRVCVRRLMAGATLPLRRTANGRWLGAHAIIAKANHVSPPPTMVPSASSE